MLESWFSNTPTDIDTIDRVTEAQQRVDAITAHMALYHYDSCGFCARVRRAITALKLNIEQRDILRDADHRADLASGGGRTTVPCLRIDDGAKTTWMYESADIIAYLNQRFGTATSKD